MNIHRLLVMNTILMKDIFGIEIFYFDRHFSVISTLKILINCQYFYKP